jgi:hypothetical protein
MSSSQRNLVGYLFLGGGALVILSQITQMTLPIERRSQVIIPMVFGLLFFLLGAVASKEERTFAWLVRVLNKPSQWLEIQPWQVVALMLSLFYVVLAHYAAGYEEKVVNLFVAWTAWLIGIASCIAGGWKSNDLNLRSTWKPFAFALGLTILALPFRAIATNQIPIFLNGDEASAGIEAIRLMNGTINNPFVVGWYSFPSLYFLISAASISLLGHTTEALRIPSAIAGALTVGGTYLAGRAMFDKRTGLIAALLLIGFHFHIHFSRIGLNNIWDGLFFVTAVGAALYAWEQENRNAYILVGLGLGLSQYFYPSSRILVVVVFGGIILSGLFNRARLKRSLPKILMMTMMMFIVVLPLAWYYVKYPLQYLAPFDRVSIIGPWLTNEVQTTGLPTWQILLKQLILGVQAFTYIPLQFWYQPGVPFLRPLYAGVFILGLVYLITHPKDSRTITLLLWLALYVLVGGLSESTPASQRYVAVAPVCMLVIAYGLSETGNVLERLWPQSTRWMTVVVIIIAIFLSMDDANFYFNIYTPHTAKAFALNDGMVAQRLADYLHNKPDGTQVVFIGDYMGYYSIPSTMYLVPQVTGTDLLKPWGDPENIIPHANHLTFVILPQKESEILSIQADYPGGTLQKQLTPYNETLFWIYEYSANTNTP